MLYSEQSYVIVLPVMDCVPPCGWAVEINWHCFQLILKDSIKTNEI